MLESEPKMFGNFIDVQGYHKAELCRSTTRVPQHDRPGRVSNEAPKQYPSDNGNGSVIPAVPWNSRAASAV
ncbi:hypothetical protein GLOTRDRAFT_99191 [Gloeophyllum trabeum ATCC 11539]|uniref:Uncharacterized protein n=1 Tax=Gloeophyllum trabeum (strain ATCC 11539 / FP-39264 / Madison 617) TaxID=670483 RepID=S7QCA9_GLOTA|nr:uncharacterized protein GLOTRDRAFT_99191 [Gloeophyllum trabeum ATCC 11539]EPQ56993.1 hypothetical protein GLOTRDRAFT_99191 [Gloeophyllum trabeum ATCC 11539]